MKCLLVDIVFPRRYATWRNVEINSFVERFETDILIITDYYINKSKAEFDFEFCNEFGLYNDYNILVFDPKFNYIDKYNKKIDGISFNNKHKGTYLFTKNETFEINDYDFIYFIFKSPYIYFNKLYNFPQNKQFIHLYPGGGFNIRDSKCLNGIPKDVNIISTFFKTDDLLLKNEYKFISCSTGTLLEKTFVYPNRTELLDKETPFKVCFACFHRPESKGIKHFEYIVDEYREKYPDDNVEFVSIGSVGHRVGINPISKVDYRTLEQIYRTCSIYLNLEIGRSFDGWPLGAEAMKNGCVMITTDTQGSARHHNIPENSIIVENDHKNYTKIIKTLYEDRKSLYAHSRNSKQFVMDYLSYEAQQQKIFDFIKSKIGGNEL